MVAIEEVKRQIKVENRTVANWIIHYRERKRKYEERKQEIIAGKREDDENVGGGRSSLPGKPVENITCKIDEHEHSDTAVWLQTVEDVKAIVGPKKKQLIEFRQECKFYISPDGGRPGWIAPVQQRFGEITGWVPSEQVLKNYWNDIVTMTARVAMARGCKF